MRNLLLEIVNDKKINTIKINKDEVCFIDFTSFKNFYSYTKNVFWELRAYLKLDYY